MSSTVDSDTVLMLPAAGLWLWSFLDSLSSSVSPIPILTAGPDTGAASYLCQRIRMYPNAWGRIAPSAEKFWEWLILRVAKGPS